MLRYALYARKSKEDKSGLIKSIEDQKAIWQEMASQQGLQIEAVYEENKTAKIPGVRPVYNAMLAELRAGAFNAILVWHVNRLARNMEEGGFLAQMLIDGKIKEIRTPHWTYRPGDNILPLLLEQGTATQYSLDLSEAVIRGTNSMVEAGGWPHRAKIGYMNARDPMNPKRGIIIKDPDRFGLVKAGFDLLLTGAYSVRQVVDKMNREWGFQTRGTPQRPGGPLSYSGGHQLFTDPFYAGFTTHNGVQRRGTHQPMVTTSEFNGVQEVVRRKYRARRRTHHFLYAGLLQCGFCGMQVTAEGHVKAGKYRIYYRCSDPYMRCTKRGLPETDLEQKVLAALESVTVDPHLCELAIENIARWQGAQSQGSEEVLQRQHRALEEIETQRDNLLTMMLRGLLADEETYKAKERSLLRERNSLQRAIQATSEELEHIRRQARAGAGFLRHARDAFLVADDQRKREIARSLGLRYTLRDKELHIEIDPLLIEMVKFTDAIMTKFEPTLSGSESQNRADFSLRVLSGRDIRIQVDPPGSLIQALRKSVLPDLFAQSEKAC